MDMMQDGVKVYCLPESAHCTADKENRSPLEINCCPIDHEVCGGECMYYEE